MDTITLESGGRTTRCWVVGGGGRWSVVEGGLRVVLRTTEFLRAQMRASPGDIERTDA